MNTPHEPTIDELNVSDDAPDALELMIQNALDTRPGFADVWAPLALVSQMIDERRRLGLSQEEIAKRMGVARTAVAKLESDPSAVAFSRITAYARAIGAGLVVTRSKEKPRPVPTGRGRRVAVKA